MTTAMIVDGVTKRFKISNSTGISNAATGQDVLTDNTSGP